jgi:uncharacterized ferritin-like protein (DUF455 family)
VTGHPRNTTKNILGVDLRKDPARDTRFIVAQLPRELCEYTPGTQAWRRESLHRHFNTEIQSMEIAAQSLADFPDAPWELRLQHARQCWDEARHAKLVERQLVAQGGRPGDFPIINYDWGVACAIPTLTGRLAVQNRTVEAGEMDVLRQLRDVWKQCDELETAAVMDGILADEIQHVRFANDWIKQEMRRNPRVMMDVASAMSYIRDVTETFIAAGEQNQAGIGMSDLEPEGFALNVEDRRLAGFGDEDLAALQKADAPKPTSPKITRSWWQDVDAWRERAEGALNGARSAYRFGGLVVNLNCTYQPLLDNLESSYGDCAVSGGDGIRCSVQSIANGPLVALKLDVPAVIPHLAEIAHRLLRPRRELQHFVVRDLGNDCHLIDDEREPRNPFMLTAPSIAVIDTRFEPFEFLMNFLVGVAQLAQISMMFIHAGALNIAGHGTLLIGASRRGKSTTAAALAMRGHALLGDETIGLRPESRDLWAFHRTLRIRPGPHPPALLQRLGEIQHGTRTDANGAECAWVRRGALFPGPPPPVPLALSKVFFLRSFANHASVEPFVPTLSHIAELSALPMSLSAVASWPVSPAHRLMRFVKLIEVFRRCCCYFVDLGPPEETAALIERTVQNHAQRP